eukprot:1641460-Amphidinium_carterae.1
MCDCAPGYPCHGEVLVQLLAQPPVPSERPPDVPSARYSRPRTRVKNRRSPLLRLSGAAALLASAAPVLPARAVEVR